MGARTTQRVEGAHWTIKQVMTNAGRLKKLSTAINLHLQKHVSRFHQTLVYYHWAGN